MTARRQLAAILFCDIPGFSSMMHNDPILGDKIRERHLHALKEAHDKYHGKIMQQFGDSTLSVFQSAAEAVECAYHLQLELGTSPEIPLRIGIHTGEIVQDEHGVYGEGIKIASRVERICPPGSILFTSKVYDDIKNHPWLTTETVGHVNLDDLGKEYSLFALTNRGLPRVIPKARVAQPSAYPESSKSEEDHNDPFLNHGGKNQYVAGFLALIMGTLGAHRFYLGQRFRGIVYMFLTAMTIIISAEEHVPVFLAMILLSLVDAILLFVMPSREFDFNYNEKFRQKVNLKKEKGSKKQKLTSFRLFKEAFKKMEERRFKEAIPLFDQVLQMDPNNAEAHYYLACCFSELKNVEDSLYHLDTAMNYGTIDNDRIEKEKMLHYVRSQALAPRNKPAEKKETLVALPSPTPNLLDDRPALSQYEKIEELGEKLAKGELSSEEFELEKVKILQRI